MKVICLDWGYYIHKAIFSKQEVPSTYMCMRMIIGDLKKVGVQKDDLLIAAADNYSAINWRKTIYKDYKGDRAKKRAESDIDFKAEYKKMNWLRDSLDASTPIHFISLCTNYNNQLVALEADDIMAVACVYYKDKEVVLLSADKDLEQLCIHNNVKIFSPISKYYKVINNPERVLTQKILGKEVTDNLHNIVSSEIDYEIRKKIVSLLELPAPIVNCAEKSLDILEEKCYTISMFPHKSLSNNFFSIYNCNGITYERSVERYNRKKKKAKIKLQNKKQLNLL